VEEDRCQTTPYILGTFALMNPSLDFCNKKIIIRIYKPLRFLESINIDFLFNASFHDLLPSTNKQK
jgi:hypothetical protein